jgi:hypothetical protein
MGVFRVRFPTVPQYGIELDCSAGARRVRIPSTPPIHCRHGAPERAQLEWFEPTGIKLGSTPRQ